MDFQKICMEVCQVARKAGKFIADQRKTFSSDKIEIKGFQNFVSYVDKESEKMIVEELRKIVPPAAILAEEGTAETSTETLSDYLWIIDPLDGTTNFIHGIPPYCVSIALTYKGKVVVGVIYEITVGECFYAWEGSASYLNGEIISVSKQTEISNSLVISGLAYNVEDVRDRFNELFDYFNRHSHGARRTGSAAANLAYVAAGRVECFYQPRLSPWDVAAGAFIVQQAGGKVTDFSNGDDYIFGQELVAANKIMHPLFLEIVK